MNKMIFEYVDYKLYLKDFLKSKPGHGYGIRSKMAVATSCRPAFISQVLNEGLHFSAEQTEALNDFFGHDKDESIYFHFLVQFERAGTKKLRERIKSQMEELNQKRMILKDRVDIKATLSAVDQATYYSSWLYAAVHMLTTIPKYQAKESIAGYLKISTPKLNHVIEFLVSVGLVVKQRGLLRPGISRIFIGVDSPMIVPHHKNWRLRAINSLEQNLSTDLHLSSVVTVNHDDAEKIKRQLIRFIEEIRQQVKQSTDEDELHCFSVDFFNVN